MDKTDLNKIKLIVFDLDGTLLNYEDKVGDESILLVKKLENLGVQFTFATGRLHSAITEHADALEITAPLISLDGSLIKNHPEGKIFYNSYLPEKNVKKIIKLADDNLVKIALCHAEAIFFSEYDVVIPQLLEKFGARYKEVSSYDGLYKETLEVVLTSDYKDSIKAVEKKLFFPYGFGLATNFYKTRSSGKFYFLELRKKGSSKGTGVKRVMKYLGVKKFETASIGDWYNDRELFKVSGINVALENAVPEIKRMAHIVTKRNNDEDGVAEFLEMVLKAKGG